MITIMCYKRIVLTLATALMISGPVNAATTVTYNFNADQATQNATISGTDPDISASSLTFVGLGSFDSGDTNDWWIENTTPTGDTSNYLRVASAVADGVLGDKDAGDYIEFSVSANTLGFSLTGASFEGRMERNFDGNFTYSLRSSIDDYSSDLFSGSHNGNSWVTRSNTSIAGVSDQTSTTFRLYMDITKRTGYLDNLELTFEPSAIPEPSSALLLFGGIAALFALRRKK
jgi:hypothetical protein